MNEDAKVVDGYSRAEVVKLSRSELKVIKVLRSMFIEKIQIEGELLKTMFEEVAECSSSEAKADRMASVDSPWFRMLAER